MRQSVHEKILDQVLMKFINLLQSMTSKLSGKSSQFSLSLILSGQLVIAYYLVLAGEVPSPLMSIFLLKIKPIFILEF